jgi:hypothetical protein
LRSSTPIYSCGAAVETHHFDVGEDLGIIFQSFPLIHACKLDSTVPSEDGQLNQGHVLAAEADLADHGANLLPASPTQDDFGHRVALTNFEPVPKRAP